MVEIYVILIPKEFDIFSLKEKMLPLLNGSKFSDWNTKITRQTMISMLGYAFVQFLVRQKYGIQNQNPIPIKYTQQGKPFFSSLSNLYFNISHSGQYVCVAFSKQEIGVDIERTRTCKPEIVRRFFHHLEVDDILDIPAGIPRDVYFTQLWALKESYVKHTGTGIANVFNTFSIQIKEGTIQTSENVINVYFKLYEQLEGYQLSICSSGNTFCKTLEFVSVEDILS